MTTNLGAFISRYAGTSANVFDSIGAMVWIAVISFGIAGLILWKGKSLTYNYRLLLAMFFFFVGTIASGNGFYLRMSRGALVGFQIYESGIVTGKGTFYYKDFLDAYIFTEQQVSFINPGAIQDQMKVLLIEMDNGRRYSFTEKNYPVDRILSDLQDAYARFREKN